MKNPVKLFDYLLSRFNAVYKFSGGTYGSVDHGYLFEKLNYVAKVIDADYDGSFRNFVEALKNEEKQSDYELTA